MQREEEIFSLSLRPFQEAKQSGKMICSKCFEEGGMINFFAQGAGLTQHFGTMHCNTALDSAKCSVCSSGGGKQLKHKVFVRGTLEIKYTSSVSFQAGE